MFFDTLKPQIEHATRQAFLEMCAAHGHEGICAFALYSDDGAMTVCPSTNTLQRLQEKADPDNLVYYKFEPAEWAYEMQGADLLFNNICSALYEQLKTLDENDETAFPRFKNALFSTCQDVLEKLKNEDFFDTHAGQAVFLTFSVSDHEFSKQEAREIVTRLNNNGYVKEYLDWVETW